MALTSIAFLMAFAGGCLLAVLRHPIYGLVTYTAVYYLHPPSRWWGQGLPDLRWSLLAAGVTLLAVLLRSRETREITTPLFRHKVMLGFILFWLWAGIQTLWASNLAMHLELLTLLFKYALLIGLVYKCIESEKHLRLFLWTHVAGCFYLGWLVFTTYRGGRFEGFGGPDIAEANSGALQIVTGILVGSSLLLAGKAREKGIVIGLMPFIINALVATISRSGFLAATFSGVIFYHFTPHRLKKVVRVLSVFALILFLLLTNPSYWMRISSITQMGEEVQGVDTGSGRLVLIQAQWDMFLDHPLGCGHRCTAVLSRTFLDDRYLTGQGENRARSSHSTPMTMLVEHGIPGAIMYLLLLVWIFRTLRSLHRNLDGTDSFSRLLLPAVAASLGAVTIGDLFVDYLKLEVRIWFIATVMVLVNLADARSAESIPTDTSRIKLGSSRASKGPQFQQGRLDIVNASSRSRQHQSRKSRKA